MVAGDRDAYGAEVKERDTARGDEFDTGNFYGDRFDRTARYLGDREGEDRAGRTELRGERGYQYGLSRDAQDDEYRRAGFEEDLRDGRYRRGLGTASMGFGAESPANAYSDAGDRADRNSADGYGLVGAGMDVLGGTGRRRGADFGARQRRPRAQPRGDSGGSVNRGLQ